MNERFRPDAEWPGLPWPATTQAAEGMPRRAWTLADIDAMVRAGIIDEDERFELIGGEVVPMSPKGATHENVKGEINARLLRSIPDELRMLPETTLRLDERSFIEPDFIVFPRSVPLDQLNGSHVLLAVEVADTSLRYDLGRKIATYAAHDIPEVWVVNALTLVTHVHRRLHAGGYGEIVSIASDGELTAMTVPSIRFTLSSLGLKPVPD